MTFQQLFSQIGAEFQSNQRLRLGFYAITAIAAFYLLLVLGDYRDTLKNNFFVQSASLNKIKSLANEREWLDRVVQTKKIRDALEQQLWVSDSPGLAKADAQAWLGQIVNDLDIVEMRVVANEEVATQDDNLWIVEVNIQGRFEPSKYLELLSKIESNNKIAKVIFAEFNRESLPFFRMTVRVYFLALTKVPK